MSLRRAKQIIYLAFYCLVWYGLASGAYYLFLKPAPTCFDNIKNQGEEGIDCGGPCAKACTPVGVKPIELVEPVVEFSTDPSHFSLLAHVSNPNPDQAARVFTYSFSLYDEAGNLVKTFQGSSFIYAGEVKYVLLPNVVQPLASFSSVDFKVEHTDWIPGDSFAGPPALSISNIDPQLANGTITVSGQVANKDTITFPKVVIMSIFKGQFGQQAGVSLTEIDNISPNQSQPFSVIHPFITGVDLAGTKVFVYAERP